MPRSSTGKWVSRVAATGGGRTYRGQVPVNWYAALILIVILGLVSIVIARHSYQHPHKVVTAQPAVGTTLYAGLAIDVCGTVQPPLPASTNTNVVSITTPGQGVINVSPKSAAQAGDHATLGTFFVHYPSALLTPTHLEVRAKLYTNGKACPTGTPDAGKKGYVTAQVWLDALSNKATAITGNPATFKIPARSLITVGFVPKGAKLPKPAQSVINTMLALSANIVNGTTTSSTPTTSPPATTTPTTGPATTTTTTRPTGTTTTTTRPTGTTTTTKA